jgi:hypothetical protein
MTADEKKPKRKKPNRAGYAHQKGKDKEALALASPQRAINRKPQPPCYNPPSLETTAELSHKFPAPRNACNLLR